MDLPLKRHRGAAPVQRAQAPREVFAEPTEAEGSYKAVFENMTDLNLQQQYTRTNYRLLSFRRRAEVSRPRRSRICLL